MPITPAPVLLPAAATENAASGRRRHVTLALTCAAFIAANTAADHLLSGQPATLHSVRPAVMLLPTVLLAAVTWRRRHQLTPAGQLGLSLCFTGIAANWVNTLTDSRGVAIYMNVPLTHGVVFASNLADAFIVLGFAVAVTTTLNASLSGRRAAATAGASERPPAGPAEPGTADAPNVVVLHRHLEHRRRTRDAGADEERLTDR